VPVSGDFAPLDNMVRVVAALAGKGPVASQFRHELLTNCAAAAHGELENSFRSGTDPYGRPWKPLTSRTGRPLLDTGILAASYQFKVTNDGFIVSTNLIYAALHQYGGIVRAKNVPYLLFFTRGAPTAGNKRGAKSWHRVKQVTIPRRQQVPDGATGGLGRWGDAINAEAEATMAAFVKKLV
jgi:phage gpG-like protein